MSPSREMKWLTRGRGPSRSVERANFSASRLRGCVCCTLAIIISPVPDIVNSVAKSDTAQIEEKIAEIQRAIGAMQYLSSGTLLKRTKVCGNPGCHCARDPAARHGPYYGNLYQSVVNSLMRTENEGNYCPNRYTGQIAPDLVISSALRRRSVASTVPLPIRQAHLSRQSESSAA